MKINAESGEVILQNTNGDTIIIPKTHREKVLKHIEEGNYKAIDDIAESLPFMEDYADEGSLIVEGIGPGTPTDPTEKEKTKAKDPSTVIGNLTMLDKLGKQQLLAKASPDVLADKYMEELAWDESIPQPEDPTKYKQELLKKYTTNEDLYKAIEERQIRNKLDQDRLTAYETKRGEVASIDYSDVINQVREHQKTNYGKDTEDIKHFKSSVAGYNLTPIHKKIKEDIYKAADAIGLDRYQALALAMMESNVGTTTVSDRSTGKGIFTSHNATGFEEPMMKYSHMSRYSASTKAFADYLAKNKVKFKYKKDPKDTEGTRTYVDVNELPLEEYSKYNKEFIETINKQKPTAKSDIEAALLFYKKNPKGYNPGNPKYVATVNSLANQLKEQGF